MKDDWSLKDKEKYFGEAFKNEDHSVNSVSKEIYCVTGKHTRMICFKAEDIGLLRLKLIEDIKEFDKMQIEETVEIVWLIDRINKRFGVEQ